MQRDMTFAMLSSRKSYRWKVWPGTILALVGIFALVYSWSAFRSQRQKELDTSLWVAVGKLDVSAVKRLLLQGANPNAPVPEGAVPGDRTTHGSRPEQWLRHLLHLPRIERHVPFTIYQSAHATLENVY